MRCCMLTGLIPVMIESIKEQQSIIISQQKQIDDLKNDNGQLKTRLDKLEKLMMKK